MAKKTHTGQAIDILEICGYRADRVDRTERFGGRSVSRDLFNIFDLLAVGQLGIALVQVTEASNVSHRLKKMLSEEHVEDLKRCLQAGAIAEVWGIRNEPDRHGSILLARSFVYEDMNLRVVEGSLIVDA